MSAGVIESAAPRSVNSIEIPPFGGGIDVETFLLTPVEKRLGPSD